jgi:hypothetical protein
VDESLELANSDTSLTHKTSVADFRQSLCRFHATSYATSGLVLVWQLPSELPSLAVVHRKLLLFVRVWEYYLVNTHSQFSGERNTRHYHCIHAAQASLRDKFPSVAKHGLECPMLTHVAGQTNTFVQPLAHGTSDVEEQCGRTKGPSHSP